MRNKINKLYTLTTSMLDMLEIFCCWWVVLEGESGCLIRQSGMTHTDVRTHKGGMTYTDVRTHMSLAFTDALCTRCRLHLYKTLTLLTLRSLLDTTLSPTPLVGIGGVVAALTPPTMAPALPGMPGFAIEGSVPCFSVEGLEGVAVFLPTIFKLSASTRSHHNNTTHTQFTKRSIIQSWQTTHTTA